MIPGTSRNKDIGPTVHREHLRTSYALSIVQRYLSIIRWNAMLARILGRRAIVYSPVLSARNCLHDWRMSPKMSPGNGEVYTFVWNSQGILCTINVPTVAFCVHLWKHFFLRGSTWQTCHDIKMFPILSTFIGLCPLMVTILKLCPSWTVATEDVATIHSGYKICVHLILWAMVLCPTGTSRLARNILK